MSHAYRQCAQVIQVAQDRDSWRALDVPQLGHITVEPDDPKIDEGHEQPGKYALLKP
jgi:hypothetical protein